MTGASDADESAVANDDGESMATADGDEATAATGDADGAGPTETEKWVVVAGLWLLSASAAAYEIVPASVTPVIMDGLGIGPAAVGWIVGVMFGTAVVFSVPVGVALDRIDPRRALTLAAVALVVAGVGGWQAALDGAYWTLLATRVLGGAAFTVIWNAGLDVLGRSFAAERGATVIGVFSASGPAGFGLGQLLGPQVAATWGWPAIFAVFAGLSALGFVVFRLASGRLALARAAGSGPDRAALGRALTDRQVWLVCGMGFSAFSLYLFVNSWMPTYLTTLGLSLAESGLLVALFPAVGAVSRTAGGVLSDRAFGGRRRPVARLSFVAAVPLVALLAVAREFAVLLVLLGLAGFFVQLGQGLFYTYVRELAAPDVRATSVALLTAVGLLGSFVAPVVAGWILQVTGSYPLAFAYAVLLGAGGLVLAWVAPEP